jgi:hypothetical protein
MSSRWFLFSVLFPLAMGGWTCDETLPMARRVLNLDPKEKSTRRIILRAFRKIAKTVHPDKSHAPGAVANFRSLWRVTSCSTVENSQEQGQYPHPASSDHLFDEFRKYNKWNKEWEQEHKARRKKLLQEQIEMQVGDLILMSLIFFMFFSVGLVMGIATFLKDKCCSSAKTKLD